MEATEDQLHEMERHALGQMDEKERRAFEEKLKEADFAQDYRAVSAAIQASKVAGREQERKRLKEIRANMQARRQSRTRRIPIWAAAVAAILILAGGYWWFGSGGRTGDLQDVYAEHFEPYPDFLTTAGPVLVGQDVKQLDMALQAYNGQRYRDAISGFRGLLNRNEDEQLLRIYLAVSYLESSLPDSALQVLMPLTQDAKSLLRGPAWWYKGFAHLQMKQSGKAKKAFSKAVEYDPSYKEKVKEIRADMPQ